MLKTPPASLLCDPHSCKFLDFAGPREILPLPCQDYPDVIDFQNLIDGHMMDHCDRVLNVLMSQPIGDEMSVDHLIDEQVGLPHEDDLTDPENIGWIKFEWEPNTK